MREEFARTQLLLGEAAMRKLSKAHIAVFGIGGVGGHCVEALVRSGVGEITLVDNDTVSPSNLNRQIVATHSTIGQYKVDVMAERIKDINPECTVHAHKCFFLPETKEQFDFASYSYVVDAVDTVTAKIALVTECQKAGTPIISSMGAGNHLDPTSFRVADIYKTSMCPLAKVMRQELKKRQIPRLKVVYSTEPPITPQASGDSLVLTVSDTRRPTPGSTAFVPSVAGLIIAGEVIRDITR